MYPEMIRWDEDIKSRMKNFFGSQKHFPTDNATRANIQTFINHTKYLKFLKENDIIDDEIFQFATAYIISRFITNEIDTKIYKVILKLLMSDSFHELDNELEHG